jgi:hypothetical protein
MHRHVTRWSLLLVPVVVGGLLAMASCSSGSGLSPVGLAQGCSINSDCNSPLICAFGKCHEACQQSRDCPSGERCVSGGMDNVCELPTESTCSSGSQCPTGLTCSTTDMQCRNGCTTSADCTVAGDLCANGACYSPMEAAEAGIDTGSDAGVDAPEDTGEQDSTMHEASVDSTAPADTGSAQDSGIEATVEAGCVATMSDGGGLGFKPSNFDPGALAAADGAAPPDYSCGGGCDESTLPTPAVISLPGSCPTGPTCFASLYVVHDFTITTSGTLSLRQQAGHSLYPVIIAALGAVDIQGTLWLGAWDASGAIGGAGGNPAYGGTDLGPGAGGAGGSVLFPNSGPGGGSFCGTGGLGGGTSPLASGGTPYGTANLIPLLGGSGGGYGNGMPGGYTGGSGGGIQITSAVSITVRSNGNVFAGGGSYYSGGGSGGAILLEAPLITIQGRVTANGGSGGSNTGAGQIAGATALPSDQPANAGGDVGSGSAGASIDGANGSASDAGAALGGGGGGAGWIRLNSACGATIEPAAIISPYLTTTCASQAPLQH